MIQRCELVDVARQYKLHPNTIVDAVNAGQVDAWRHGTLITVDADQAAQLADVGEIEWIAAWRWSRDHHHKITTTLERIRLGELDGLDHGKGRRWVFAPSQRSGER